MAKIQWPLSTSNWPMMHLFICFNHFSHTKSKFNNELISKSSLSFITCFLLFCSVQSIWHAAQWPLCPLECMYAERIQCIGIPNWPANYSMQDFLWHFSMKCSNLCKSHWSSFSFYHFPLYHAYIGQFTIHIDNLII